MANGTPSASPPCLAAPPTISAPLGCSGSAWKYASWASRDDAVLAVREQQVRHLDAVFGPFGNSGGGAVLHVVGVGDDDEDACAVVKQKLLHLSPAFP